MNYGKRQLRRSFVEYIGELVQTFPDPKDIIVLPELPDDLEGKTYSLKLVNGEIKWVEEE